jgi:hypothetical protein
MYGSRQVLDQYLGVGGAQRGKLSGYAIIGLDFQGGDP